jgi:hypothetical protein
VDDICPGDQRSAGSDPDQTLEAGQVYTVETGIAVPGYGYFGLEEDVLVAETGADPIIRASTLTTTPKEHGASGHQGSQRKLFFFPLCSFVSPLKKRLDKKGKSLI